MLEHEHLLFGIRTVDPMRLHKFFLSTRNDPGEKAELTQECLLADTPACNERCCNKCRYAKADHTTIIDLSDMFGFTHPDPDVTVKPHRSAKALDTVIYESPETIYEEESVAIKVTHERGVISLKYP